VNLELNQHRVLVVGAAGTIGKAVALAFLEEGCSVVMLDQREVNLEMPIHLKDRCHALKGDVQDAADVDRSVAYCQEHLGGLDHAVYAVGAGSGKYGFPFWNLSPSDWPRVIDVNLMGAVHLAHAFAPEATVKPGRTLCLMASVAGQIGSQTDPPYSAAKAALINFMQCVAKDFAPYGARANAIAPGMIPSALNQSVWASSQVGLSDKETIPYAQWGEEKLKRTSPMGQWQRPEDCASMVTYLASHHARHITGQVLNIDGGQVMHA